MDLFYQGGPLFMGILSMVGLLLIAAFIAATMGKVKFSAVRELGLLALVIGVLGQLIGLYEGFKGLEQMSGSVNPALIMGGLKVSMISMLYGVILFVLSRVFLLIKRVR